jgi:hypothetical protein
MWAAHALFVLHDPKETVMYRTPPRIHDRACDCRCPTHHGQRRTRYDNPRCRCLISCASQPTTLLAPHIGGALFLDRHDTLWHVPGLEPGHWDWRSASQVTAGHPLSEAAELITNFLCATHESFPPLAYRL